MHSQDTEELYHLQEDLREQFLDLRNSYNGFVLDIGSKIGEIAELDRQRQAQDEQMKALLAKLMAGTEHLLGRFLTLEERLVETDARVGRLENALAARIQRIERIFANLPE